MKELVGDSKIYYKVSTLDIFSFCALIIMDLFIISICTINSFGQGSFLFVLIFVPLTYLIIWMCVKWKIVIITEDEIIICAKWTGKVLYRKSFVTLTKLDLRKHPKGGITMKLFSPKYDMYQVHYEVFIDCGSNPDINDMITFFENKGLKNIISKETYKRLKGDWS